jgi:phosphate transport system substrate-binding protein
MLASRLWFNVWNLQGEIFLCFLAAQTTNLGPPCYADGWLNRSGSICDQRLAKGVTEESIPVCIARYLSILVSMTEERGNRRMKRKTARGRRNQRTTAIYVIVFLVIGLVSGYLVTSQVANAKIADLQDQVDKLKEERPRGSISAKGSGALLTVSRDWAAAYMDKYTGVNIFVSGGGSDAGIQALIDKATNICQTSRKMNDSEIESAKANDVYPVEWTVGFGGVSIVISPENNVTTLTLGQLNAIYNGTYTNWSQVGGNDSSIMTYGTEKTSGTYDYFSEHVLHNQSLRGDYVEVLDDNTVVQVVQGDSGAVGFVGVASISLGEDVKVLAIKASDSEVAYDPSVENIKNGTYPLAGKLYIYTDMFTLDPLDGYISFMLGPTGQVILEDAGYVSYARSTR